MTTAAIYVRISKDKTGEEWGVREQEEVCRRLAQQRGLKVAKVYVENDLSAMKDRPVFDGMLAEVGRYDAIVVKHVDRLYRRLAQLESIIPSLQETPVYAALSGNIDLSTADGRLHARMLGAVAQHEIEKGSERMRARRQQRIAQGLWMGPVPRGYLRSNGVMTLDPEWAPKVADAAQSVLAGDSMYGVARRLGISSTSLRALLKSPAIAGLTSRKTPGQWEAIVPEGDWWRLQALLADRKRPGKQTPRTAGLSLLGGIATCSHGVLMHASGTGTYRAAHCLQCDTTMQRGALDKQVTEWVLATMADPQAASAFQAPEESIDFKRIEALKAKRKTLASLVADELLDEADARQQLEAIKEELAALETAARPAVVLDNADPEVVAEVWEAMTIEEQRRLVRLLCTVEIQPGVRGHLSNGRVWITAI